MSDPRIDHLEQRLDAVDRRLESMSKDILTAQDRLGKRFESVMERQSDRHFKLMVILLVILASVLVQQLSLSIPGVSFATSKSPPQTTSPTPTANTTSPQ